MTEFDSQFLEPWIPERSKAFIEELNKEMAKQHVLYNEELEVVARRTDKDDVLFRFKKSTDKYVQVHLTWKMREENNPHWPRFQIHNSFEDWRNIVMKQDNKEFEDE